jgi:2-keto-myo-inositol isomerase
MHEFIPCFNTSTIRPAGLKEKIRLAGAAGFRAIELWNDDVTAYLQGGGTMEEIRSALKAAGLTVPSVIAVLGWIGCADGEREERRAEAVRRMEQAKALGSPFVVTTPPRGQTDLERAGRDYRELLEIGRRIGVRPVMEFLGFVEHVNNINTAWEIVERAGDPSGTIVIDFFHMVRGERSTVEDLRSLPPERIGIVHLDDVPYSKPFGEMSDADRVYPGDGDIPLDEMIGTLRSMSYRGPVSLELFNRDYWAQDPAQVVKTGFEKSRRFFE